MRWAAKLSLVLLVAFVGQMGFDVVRAASDYPGFMNAARLDDAEAQAADEVEARLAQSNRATRWVAGQVLGFSCRPG